MEVDLRGLINPRNLLQCRLWTLRGLRARNQRKRTCIIGVKKPWPDFPMGRV